MSKITVYKHCREVDKPFYQTVEQVVNRIKSGRSIDLVKKVRSAVNDEEKSQAKKQLPAYSWAGVFTKRSDSSIKEHSGLFCMDLDDLSWAQLIEIKKELVSDKYCHILFVSPSGTGLKLVVKIPPSITTHKDSGRALFEYYSKYSFDPKQLDPSRLCFESYDQEIYWNQQSEVFTEFKAEERKEPAKLNVSQQALTDEYEIISRLLTWLNKRGEFFGKGNRNNFVYRLCCACNRFGVDFDVLYNKLLSDYQSDGFLSNEIEQVIKNVYTNQSNKYATAQFDKHERIISNDTKQEIHLVDTDPTTPVKDVIYLSDIREQMLDTFRNGHQHGTTTYFQTIDKHWKWKKGEITLMHGLGNDGKTTMMLQLMLIKSIKEGDKWAIFSPEQYPPIDFYNDLIHMYIGKTTDKRYIGVMSEREYNTGMDFMMEHFYFVYPENDSPTPEYMEARFEECIAKHSVFGCLTDPFNQLDNDWKKYGRDDLYLSDYLSKKKRFALHQNIYDLTIAHPRGNAVKNASGDYGVPDVYDLANGAMWNNKMDNILCTHRPRKRSAPDDPTVDFYSQKIKKQKLVGKTGFTGLQYNFHDMRYYEEINGVLVSPFGNELEIKIPDDTIPF
jgi:hypothetical protein